MIKDTAGNIINEPIQNCDCSLTGGCKKCRGSFEPNPPTQPEEKKCNCESPFTKECPVHPFVYTPQLPKDEDWIKERQELEKFYFVEYSDVDAFVEDLATKKKEWEAAAYERGFKFGEKSQKIELHEAREEGKEIGRGEVVEKLSDHLLTEAGVLVGGESEDFRAGKNQKVLEIRNILNTLHNKE